jgi:hypothetical protein
VRKKSVLRRGSARLPALLAVLAGRAAGSSLDSRRRSVALTRPHEVHASRGSGGGALRTMRLTWLLCVAGAAASEAKKKPTNFVVLFLDDHGWGDAGVNVASVAGLPPVTETPRIDRMAAEGVRFADFHAGYSVCTASRGALLTGRLSPRTGVANNFGPHSIHGMNINEKTIADVLGDHGYESHMIGKWHLGHNAPYNPTWRGFHSWVGLPYSGDMGCLDVEQTELGQNGGLSQSCLSQSWSEKGQPACPVLCKYNHRSVDRRSYNDDPTGNRLGGDDVAVGEDLAWSPTPAPLSGRDNHNPDTAIPLFGAMAPNCSGYADCGRTITLAPFDPFQLSNTYKARAAEIFAMFGKNGSKSGTPFFLYVAFAHTHTPLAYPPEFNEASPRPGRLKVFGNTLAEADHTIGAILDSLDAAGLGEDTLVFLSADNGPANLGSVACEVKGSPGPYTGDWMRKPVGPDRACCARLFIQTAPHVAAHGDVSPACVCAAVQRKTLRAAAAVGQRRGRRGKAAIAWLASPDGGARASPSCPTPAAPPKHWRKPSTLCPRLSPSRAGLCLPTAHTMGWT